MLSDPDPVTDSRRNNGIGTGARKDSSHTRRAARTNAADVQFELVLKQEPPTGAASWGGQDWGAAAEEGEEEEGGQTEILLRPEDGYWLPEDRSDEPVDVSTVSISARPGRFPEGRQAENDAFIALERETRVAELEIEDSVDNLYEDVWEGSGADAVLTGTTTMRQDQGLPESLPDRPTRSFLVDDSRSWGTMPAPSQRKAVGDEASDWGGRGLANGSIAASTVSVARRPHVRAEEVGLQRQPPPRARASAGPAKATKESVQQAELLSRARELEAELEHYRAENSQLRQTRRQQEGLVAELVQQRSDLARWVAEEKAKTALWCEEQRAAIAKERRAAAKQVKDARLASTTLPSRKERAEIESLQATVEKMRLEAEAAAKKARQTERRLQQSLKDQLTAVEEQNQLILTLEREKMELLEVLASVGPAMPAMQNKKLAAEVARRAALHRVRCGVDSFVEEVPVEDESLAGVVREERSEEVLAVASEVRASLTNGTARSRYSASIGTDSDGASPETRYETTEFRPDTGVSLRPPPLPDREEELHRDGSRTRRYRNGTIKEVYANGDSLVRFTNGDTKRTVDGEVVYFYAEARTTHTTLRDGAERYEFPNGQVESHFPDGRKEILFPDGTRKTVHASGLQESRFVDGVVVREHPGGLREVVTADGRVHHDFGNHLGS